MSRVGTVYQRAIDGFKYIGQAVNSYGYPFALSDGTLLEVSGTNIYYFGTGTVWSAVPSGYTISNSTGMENPVAVRGNMLYIIGISSTGYSVRMWKVNCTTKVWTEVLSCTGDTSFGDCEIIDDVFANSNTIIVRVRYQVSGARHFRFYSFVISTETITLLADTYTSYTRSSEYAAMGEDGYFYEVEAYSGGNWYLIRNEVGSWTHTQLDTHGSYGYLPLPYGYHIRTDYTSRIYNSARSTYWTAPGQVYGGARIAASGGTDGTWILFTASNIYVATFDAGSVMTSTALRSGAYNSDPSFRGFARAPLKGVYASDTSSEICTMLFTIRDSGTGKKGHLFKIDIPRSEVM